MRAGESFAPGPLHRIWRVLPKTFRRFALAHATSWLAPRAMRDPGSARHGLTVGGEFSRASGMGETARLMAAAARKPGLPVWTIDIPPPVATPRDLPHEDSEPPPAGSPLVMHVNAPWLPLALLRLPRAISHGRMIIGYWAWELPSVPPGWRAGARCVHEIWAPSSFTAAALEPLLPGRVRVVPPPLALVPPMPSNLDRAAFGLPENAVVVLVSFNLASSFARKNPLAAIAAFRDAFGDRADRVLLLKVGNASHAPHDLALLSAAAHGQNIRILTNTLSSAGHAALIAAADILLSLHRAEGLGLVPAEAMLLGKPVIATGWSGNMQFMDAASAAIVEYSLIPAEDPRKVYGGGVWAEPSHDHAVAQLRRLADDPDARVALGALGLATARQRLGIEPFKAALQAIGLTIPGVTPRASG